jgi:spore maturation protein B
MQTLFSTIAYWAVPVLLILILMTAAHKKVKIYEVFIEGAMDGLKTTIKLTPYILAIFVAIGIFRASGALNFIVYVFRPLLNLLNIPPDLLTLGILKPLSGSASLGVTAELLNKYGPDSMIGATASLIQGSSETTFYIFSIYLGSVYIKDGRHALIMGLCGEFAAFLLAIALGALISP